LIVSAGRRGAWGLADGAWTHTPALEVKVASTAGAGDALLGGTLAGLAHGLPLTVPGPPRLRLADRPLESALDLGVLLAACSVTSPHTIHPDVRADTLAAFARANGLVLGGALVPLLRATGRHGGGLD
jgi:sugar/nucleoside kinase (ribokinase family)